MTRSLLALAGLSAALLVGCSTTTLPQLSGNRPGQVAQRYDYVINVPLQVGDTQASVARTVGGTVLSWDDSGCPTDHADTCLAVLGVNSVTPQAIQSLGLDLGRAVYIEPNRDVFSGGGMLTASMSGSRGLWAGGNFLAWTGGSRGLWAGGSYNVVPQNTQAWTKINLQAAQTMAPNLGSGVTVAVIDTGLDLAHTAFKGSLSDPSTWQDFYANDSVPQDEGTLGTGGFGHGTNVAGIILQIAPNAKIMPLRVLGPDGSGDVATVARAIDWAVLKGANIINLSLGSPDNSKVVQDAINRATAQGVLVLSSAGNDNVSKITYPAANAELKGTGVNALSIGSVDASDVKSSFSNFASQLELVAPGENVYAPAPGELLAAWSGTSQATPMAAGGLALALGQALKVPRDTLTQKMADTAFNVYNVAANAPYKDKLGVKGRLDLAAFLKATINIPSTLSAGATTAR